MIEDLFKKPIVIFGCGNTLLGDDGFGPQVIEHLRRHYPLPDSVLAEDVGTSVGSILFDYLLASARPSHLFIVDAVSLPGRKPGELFELKVGQLPANKSSNFCLHQFPSVNLLRELQTSAGVSVRVLAVQITCIPEMVQPGLSGEVRAALDLACRWLTAQVREVACT